MGIVFSEEQNLVINLRNRNILVSAAAGSGKTTVLVERIIRLISDEENPVDIDHLLIVTFTKAAAASMREKISEAIVKKLEEHYSDHLQKQETLLHHAQITTIDSFCLFILQNNFNDIGLDPGFRVADEGEIRLLKEDIMEQMLARRLEQSRSEGKAGSFSHLLDRFVKGSRADALSDILFSLYNRALSYPFPDEWLLERKKDYEGSTPEELCSFIWMQELFSYAKRNIEVCKEIALENISICEEASGPVQYLPMAEADYAFAQNLLQSCSFTELHEKMQSLSFMTLSRKKDENADILLKERVKKNREEMKDILKDLQKDFFSFSMEEMLAGFRENDRIVNEICDTLLDFHKRFTESKKEKKLIDFSDMEHYALQILLKKEDDKYVPSKTALEYRRYFHEIMIDEYQDSNLVQELLLKTISGEDDGIFNRFMVGDVKQSIYQFRLARPQIFMEKYDTYEKEVRDDTLLQRIDLAKNYRSRREIIEGVNYLFYRIMGRDLGNVAYDEESALYPGASYPEKTGETDGVELLLAKKDEDSKDKKEQEARLVSQRIKELLRSYKVTDEADGQPRPARYGDIVILLRKLKDWDEAFKHVFEKEGIPVYVEKSTGYFETGEIRTILNFLKALDNPKQDIPLFGTMISWFGKFTNEELSVIQSQKMDSLYEGVCSFAGKEEEEYRPLQEKCKTFLNWFSAYREQIAYEPIHKILRHLIKESGYLYEVASLPSGTQRLANVRMLLTKAESFEKSSYSGLFHFIRYIEKMQKYDVDFGEAAAEDSQNDVVRIMTIHKSKGLEFPICFIAGCAGAFHTKDTSADVICDSNYGIGMDYVDIPNRVKYRDIRKCFLARYMKEESMGEELRVLYVAMTRAKEKLILTGICNDFGKLADAFHLQKKADRILPFIKRANAKSFLDWITAAMSNHPSFIKAMEESGLNMSDMADASAPHIEVRCLTPQQFKERTMETDIEQGVRKNRLLSMLKDCDNRALNNTAECDSSCNALKEQLTFVYPHESLNGLYTKTSVSELKMAAMHKAYEKESMEDEPVKLFPTEEISPYIPNFAKESREVSGSERGSAYHRLLELFDFAEFMNTNVKIRDCMNEYAESGRITEEELSLINPAKINTFLDSPVALRMGRAQELGNLHKEQPFVLGIEASRLSDEFPSEEKVLIQGIIDVYFVEDNEIVLLDYKTDAIKSADELIKRYRTQMDYYAEALEKIIGLRVKEKILYSFALEKEILI